MKTPEIYIIHSAVDAVFMKQLAVELEKINTAISIDQLSMPPGSLSGEIHEALKRADIVLVIISPAAAASDKVFAEISYAKHHDKKIIPILYKESNPDLLLNNLLSIDLRSDFQAGLDQISAQINNIFIESIPGAVTYSMPAGSPSRTIYVIKSIIKSLNPFKKKRSEVRASIDYDDNSAAGSGSGKSYGSTPERGTYRGGGYTSAKPPMPEPDSADMPELASAEPPSPPPAIETPAAPQPQPPLAPQPSQSPKGKILYDIPDNMVVKQQQKCIVRIGETEAIVRDDDIFSGGEIVENIPIARVMNVGLIDINEPQRFAIKTINSAEQELEDGSYSQWLFWVTPLTEGNFSLLLKVSVIKIIDGKERRKELVFEKAVNIASQVVAVPQTLMGDQPKNLLDEKSLTELDPPGVFVSYAHKDKNYFDVFTENLAAQSNWNIWTDKNIEIGSDWYERIQQAIKDTDMAVLLVSAFFISSGFIRENEYNRISDLQKNRPGFIFLPVLLRDTDINRWQDLSKLQFFSVDGDDYDVVEFKGKLLPFAALCTFNIKGELNENFQRDTYFKNFVLKANTDWLKLKKLS